MARFACPTSSSLQSVAGPSKINKHPKPGNNAQPDVPHKRGPTYQHRGAKIKEASEAKRKDKKQKQLKQIQPQMFTHVYIGNVEASITEQQLEHHFAACGSIRKTIMRLSRGQAITVGVAIPIAKRTSRDLKYASMEFYSSKSALNALKLHGSMLEGVKLVVCAAAGDLPEVADIARPRIQNIRLKEQLAARPVPRVRALRAPKPLVRNDTEADFSDPKNDRIRIFGYSFDKCIM